MRVPARLLPFFIAILLLAAAVSAASIELSPSHVRPGEPVTVSISNLPDGARFTLLTEGVYPVPPGQPLVFQLSRFQMPFALQSGEILAHTENTRWAKFQVKAGNTTAAIEAYPEGGIFTNTESRNISAGTYEFIRLDALPLFPDKPIVSRIQLTGIKSGPQDATISFALDGIAAGELHILVIVNDSPVLNQVITIGEGGGGITGGASVISSDGVAALSGEAIADAGFVVEQPISVPSEWKALTTGYRLVTGNDPLPPGTSLVMAIPPKIAADADRYTLFIASYDNGTWTMLPSRIVETTSGVGIVTDITGPGTFALMAIEHAVPATPSPAATKSAPFPLSVLAALPGALLVFLITQGRTR